MIPEGWIHGRVGDLLIGLESGVSVNGEDRAFDHNDKAVLKVSAVSYGKFNPFAAKIINTDEIERAKTNPRAGQVIVSRSNTEELVGASAFIDSDYSNLFLPDKLWQTIPKPASNMKWLSYVLASAHVRYKLSKLATGTSGSMKNITQGELLSLKIAIPPLPEQKKIAQILSTWDNAITTTEQLLANSQQQKKALMQQLLTGKRRLKGFSGEWKKFHFSELTTLGKTKFDPKTEGQIRECVELEHISQGGSVLLGTTTTDFTASTKSVFMKGSVLFGKLRPYLRKYWLADRSGVCSTEIWVLNANKKRITPEYLYQTIQMDSFIDTANISSGTHMPRADWNVIKDLIVLTPLLEEQQKIATVFSTADHEIELLQQKLEGLKQEKKALMQQLLTGRRRVKA